MNRRFCLALLLFPVVSLILTGPSYAQGINDRVNLYGYFATRFEKTYNEPSLDGDQIVEETAVGEWTNPSLNVMMQHQIDRRFKAFLNLNGSGGEALDVRNFWGEFTASRYAAFRLGKVYRKFGLYNELLDAVPTYYGIEPPEIFDSDHLIVSRTTTLMMHGSTDMQSGVVSYALSTDNGEGDAFADATPLGYDLRYKTGTGFLTVGTSGYNTFGPANSDVSVGDGSPKSGVLPWMSEDKFWVLGGYTELNYKGWMIQSEYWHADHNAIRDAEKTVEMITGAGPSLPAKCAAKRSASIVAEVTTSFRSGRLGSSCRR